jgi:hypothetical protein
MIMVDSLIPKIKRHTSDVAAAVVDDEKEPTGQGRQRRLGTKTVIERGHHRPDVDQTAADSGERRRDDIAHPLVSVGGQEPRVSYRGNQIW